MTMQRRIYEGTPIGMEIEGFADRMRAISADMLSMASANQPGEKAWFVLHVANGRDKSVEDVLRTKNILTYLPLIPGGTAIIRGRKVKRADQPALPGYVMVSIVPSPAAFVGLARVRNVEGLLGGTDRPHKVSDEIMSRFKIKLGDLTEMAAHVRDFNKGDWVEFDEGPFVGLKGHIVDVHKMVLIRGQKKVAVKADVAVQVNGSLTRVSTPLALLVKL